MERGANETQLEARIHAIVDERLFGAFRSAAAHFETADLVVWFDESDDDPVSALPRARVLDDASLSEVMRRKLNKPASTAAKRIGVGDVSFWLVFVGADGSGAFVAVNAKLIAPGGNA